MKADIPAKATPSKQSACFTAHMTRVSHHVYKSVIAILTDHVLT